MDSLTLFGLFAVTAMLVFYALEDRSPWFILACAGACALGSVYGFLQGAWPFGVVEAIFGIYIVVSYSVWFLSGFLAPYYGVRPCDLPRRAPGRSDAGLCRQADRSRRSAYRAAVDTATKSLPEQIDRVLVEFDPMG